MPVALVNRASDSLTSMNLGTNMDTLWSNNSNHYQGNPDSREPDINEDERRRTSDVDSDDIDA